MAADNMQHAYIGRITTERRKQKIQIKIKSNKIRRLMFVTCTVHFWCFFFLYKCICLSVVCLCKLIIVTHLFFFIYIFYVSGLPCTCNRLIGHSHRRNWPFCRSRFRLRIGAAASLGDVVMRMLGFRWRLLRFQFLLLRADGGS